MGFSKNSQPLKRSSEPLENMDIKSAALQLHTARIKGFTTAPLENDYPKIGMAEAYEIMWEGIKLRQAIGEEAIGYKMGLTSEAKRKQMGLEEPIYGVLLDSMKVCSSTRFSLKGLVHPKAEPEIVFQLQSPLLGVPTPDQVVSAIGGIAAGLEILDSRYTGFKYFSLPDVVADNASASHFVVGPMISPKSFDFENTAVALKINGISVAQDLGKSVMGSPIQSVITLCELLNRTGAPLPKAGDLLFTGGVTQAFALEPGMILQCDVGGLLPASLTITGEKPNEITV